MWPRRTVKWRRLATSTVSPTSGRAPSPGCGSRTTSLTSRSRKLDRAAEQLPKTRFILQTYFHMLAAVQLDLYRGRAEAALRTMERGWGPLRWSLLLRVGVIRILALELRGRVLLAAATQATGKERERRLRRMEALATQLPREGSACSAGYAALLRAGAQALRGDKQQAQRLAEAAESAFDRASMKVHVAASRWLHGACVGGAEGAALVDGARGAMAAAGIRRPDRFMAMLAPGPSFGSAT